MTDVQTSGGWSRESAARLSNPLKKKTLPANREGFRVLPAGVEPARTAPEAAALSTELRELKNVGAEVTIFASDSQR